MDPTEATAGDTEPTADASDPSDALDAPITDASPDEPPHTVPWWGPLTIVAFVALVVCTNVANAVFAAWVDDHPAGLLALSSRQRYLALAAVDGIGVVPYVVIGTLRIAAAFVVCHLAGRAYRDSILRVFTRYLGLTPEALDAYHRGLDAAEVVIIPFFVGSNIVAALTGVRRTHPGKLAVLLAIGIAGRLALVWWLAKAFEEPLLDVVDFLQRYQLWAIIISVALVVLVNVRNFRRGRG
jgi:membrane protein DedA with SNARE-associated domain